MDNTKSSAPRTPTYEERCREVVTAIENELIREILYGPKPEAQG